MRTTPVDRALVLFGRSVVSEHDPAGRWAHPRAAAWRVTSRSRGRSPRTPGDRRRGILRRDDRRRMTLRWSDPAAAGARGRVRALATPIVVLAVAQLAGNRSRVLRNPDEVDGAVVSWFAVG